jgi:hypothetical protein
MREARSGASVATPAIAAAVIRPETLYKGDKRADLVLAVLLPPVGDHLVSDVAIFQKCDWVFQHPAVVSTGPVGGSPSAVVDEDPPDEVPWWCLVDLHPSKSDTPG